MPDRPGGGIEAARAELAGRRVLVQGYGLHGGGAGMVDFLVAVGAEVVVTEARAAEVFPPEVHARLADAGVVAHFGGHESWHLDDVDLMVRNPNVRFDNAFLAEARERGVPVEMEMTFVLRWWPGRVVGVTGTKGKSTTTTFADHVLGVARPTLKAGNLRVSAILALLTADPATIAVLELASFQLEGTGEQALSPEVAVLTNLDEDHLDVYGHLDAYWGAKASIWLHQRPDDALVLPGDDPAAVAFVDRSLAAAGTPGATRLLFAGSRLDEGDGAWTDGAALHVRVDGVESEVVRVDELDPAVRSDLAQRNLAAALCVGLAEGLAVEELRSGSLAARGVADRQELVAAVAGVAFVNDTAATAPVAAAASVRSFASGPLAVICGGKAKRSAFTGFADALADAADVVILLEHEAFDGSDELGALLDERGAAGRVVTATSVEAAIDVAVERLGAAGGTVLLAPGAASFGMFRDEFDRGERFRAHARARASAAGQPPG